MLRSSGTSRILESQPLVPGKSYAKLRGVYAIGNSS